MLHILHGADFHLDAPFTSLTAEKARQRREEQRELIARFTGLARSREADLVLLSGDLFDSADTYAETTQALCRSLGQTGCPVFIAPGNHDFYGVRSPYTALSWPENVHIFTSPALERVDLPGLDCAVYGAAFTGPAREDCPLSGFRAEPGPKYRIGVLHGEVDGAERYCPVSRADIAASGLTYLALGHVHTCSGLQREGSTWWAYPGCPEGRGFDETGDKGCLWLSLDESGDAKSEFLPLAARRYEVLEADVTGRDPAEALLSALPASCGRDILRVVLTGESGEAGLDLPALVSLAAPRCYHLELRDRTSVRRDLWDRAEEDTLTGLFLRELRSRLTRANTGEEQAMLEQAVRFGLAALEHREEPLP